jgi:hypothetical protein
VWRYCSSPSLSFVDGMNIISSRLTSGCVNITMLYLFPFLLCVYLAFVVFTFIGFVKGRLYTQEKWLHFILHFVKKQQINNVDE